MQLKYLIQIQKRRSACPERKFHSLYINLSAAFLVIIILFYPVLTAAQSLTDLETKYQNLNYSLQTEISALDSLNKILIRRANLIDLEKRKKNADKNVIKTMMANAVIISNEINAQQKKVGKLESAFESIIRKLDTEYTTLIDSLQSLENSNEFKGNKNELRALKLALIEKKILVSPKIYSLSINPGKILKINSDELIDPEERKIFFEYLNMALSEVDNQLNRIKELNIEVKQIITLQQKTRKFLEDTEFDTDISSTNFTSNQTQLDTRASSLTEFQKSQQVSLLPVQTFTMLLKQLEIQQISGMQTRTRFDIDSLHTNLSIQDYQNLMIEIEKRLSDYRLLLVNKLGTFK